MFPAPDTFRLIQPAELEGFSGPVIDVRTPEAYAEAHLPGSLNHCVYEIAFAQALPEAFPERGTALVVYGQGAPYQADLAAVGRLQALGYTQVQVLAGGLQQWQAEGRPVEGTGAVEAPSPVGRLALDTEQTRVRWVGRNLGNQHDGEVAATTGYLELNAAGHPVAGEVTVDLRQMSCRDLTDRKLAQMLIGHLSNADFFAVDQFPEAAFTLEEAAPIAGATYGQPNFLVKGTLKARGQTMPVNLTALIEPVEGGCVFQAVFDFDRTQVGAVYGSGRFFERLGMHLVNDLVTIDVQARFVAPSA